MKKLYMNLNRYLWNQNSEGEPGAGAVAGSAVDEAAAAAAAAAASSKGSSGEGVDWREALPTEFQSHDKLKGLETVEAVVKAFVNAKQAPTLPDTIKLPDGVDESVSKWAVKQGFTQKQFDAIAEQQGVLATEAVTARNTAQTEAMDALYVEWGEEKAANLALANRVIAFADPKGDMKFAEYLQSEASGFASMNPMLVKVFLNLGKAFKESGVLKSSDPGKKSVKGNIAHEMYPDQAPAQ